MHLERIESGRKYLVAGLYNNAKGGDAPLITRITFLAFIVGCVVGSVFTSMLGFSSSTFSELQQQADAQQQQQKLKSDLVQQQQQQKFKRYFPLFHPLAKEPISVKRVGPDVMWANLEERRVKPFFSSAHHHHHHHHHHLSLAVADKTQNTKSRKKRLPLTWLWINVRPHINILPVLTVGEVRLIWNMMVSSKSKGAVDAAGGAAADHRREDNIENNNDQVIIPSSSAARLLSFRAEQMMRQKYNHPHQQVSSSSSSDSTAASSSSPLQQKFFHDTLFPFFIQTKYGYRGDSLAIVGGLFDPASDKSLRQTAIRELREELGITCRGVTSHGRFVVDANRGCGNFESFFAQNCAAAVRSAGDVEEQDVEPQKLLFLTFDDVMEVMSNTRRLGARTEMPVVKTTPQYSSRNNDNKQPLSEDEVDELNERFDGNDLNDFDEDYDDDVNNNDNNNNNKEVELAQDNNNQQHHHHSSSRKSSSEKQNSYRSMKRHTLKETKWIATISMTLVALMQQQGL